MMEGIEVSIKNNKITIEITVDWIEKEGNNPDWRASHAVGKIVDQLAAAEYLVEKLNESSVDVGNGYVTPVENMLMDVLSEAYCDGADFIDDYEDEDDDE